MKKAKGGSDDPPCLLLVVLTHSPLDLLRHLWDASLAVPELSLWVHVQVVVMGQLHALAVAGGSILTNRFNKATIHGVACVAVAVWLSVLATCVTGAIFA